MNVTSWRKHQIAIHLLSTKIYNFLFPDCCVTFTSSFAKRTVISVQFYQMMRFQGWMYIFSFNTFHPDKFHNSWSTTCWGTVKHQLFACINFFSFCYPKYFATLIFFADFSLYNCMQIKRFLMFAASIWCTLKIDV